MDEISAITPLITPADRIFVAGHRGMAGSAICRALQRAGYNQILTAARSELDLLDGAVVERWFAEHQPTVVVLAAAKVGGIQANSSYPADFLLENLKIQTHVIETAWRSGVRRLLFLGSSCIYPKFAEQPLREEALLTGALEPTNEWYAIAKITGIKLCEALRRQHHHRGLLLSKPALHRLAIEQIQLRSAGREDLAVARPLQGPADGTTGHAAVAGHEDPIGGGDQRGGHGTDLINGEADQARCSETS